MQSALILSNFAYLWPLLALLQVFALSFSTVLSCYFNISVNSMTNWSVLKFPKIMWPSTFKLSFKLNGYTLSKRGYAWVKTSFSGTYGPTTTYCPDSSKLVNVLNVGYCNKIILTVFPFTLYYKVTKGTWQSVQSLWCFLWFLVSLFCLLSCSSYCGKHMCEY